MRDSVSKAKPKNYSGRQPMLTFGLHRYIGAQAPHIYLHIQTCAYIQNILKKKYRKVMMVPG